MQIIVTGRGIIDLDDGRKLSLWPSEEPKEVDSKVGKQIIKLKLGQEVKKEKADDGAIG